MTPELQWTTDEREQFANRLMIGFIVLGSIAVLIGLGVIMTLEFVEQGHPMAEAVAMTILAPVIAVVGVALLVGICYTLGYAAMEGPANARRWLDR